MEWLEQWWAGSQEPWILSPVQTGAWGLVSGAVWSGPGLLGSPSSYQRRVVASELEQRGWEPGLLGSSLSSG